MAEKTDKKVLLRVPDKVYKKLKSRAEREKRSVNSQIVHEIDVKN